MVFSSAVFLLVFLPLVFVINWICRERCSNIILLIASLIFYAWGEPVMVLLMLFSIVMNWTVGRVIAAGDGQRRKAALIVGVVLNLALLGYYKYAGFFASTVNSVFGHKIMPVPEIALPIGISFFTFQAMSYIVDVYRGDTEASKSLINVALYISFFPQLIAGPIVKYRDINRQIESRTITWRGTSDGFKRFIYGLGKKVLIANVLGACVDSIYAYDISLIDTKAAWIAAVAYFFQIYYDFSGYSDMAIGLGRMFGFKIPENFNYPYLSRSITEFWRRWHISLGSWFREYVYIPLGGNRKGTGRTYLNLGIVFFLTGLWHGADFSFVIWGLYHGFFIIVERLGFKKALSKSKIISWVYANAVVFFGWVLFRADHTAQGMKMLARMVMPWKYFDSPLPTKMLIDPKICFIMAVGFIGMGMLAAVVPKRAKERWQGSVAEAVYCTAVLILSLAAIASNTYNPFIYFQF